MNILSAVQHHMMMRIMRIMDEEDEDEDEDEGDEDVCVCVCVYMQSTGASVRWCAVPACFNCALHSLSANLL